MDQKRILIVEDESIIALEMKTRLEKLGYQVADMAMTGERAIELVELLAPDLVLMDIMLKGKMDGIEAAGHITARRAIPVIFLTAHSDEQTLQRAKVSGPFGYLVKPFQMRDLHITIEMALYRHQLEQELRASEERMRLLIESTDDVVLVQGLDRRYQYVHASSRYGIRSEDAIGKLPTDFFSQDFVDEMTIIHDQVIQTGKGTTTETEIIWNGERFWFNIHIYPVKNAAGEITSIATIGRNITETKRLKGMLPICAWCGKKIMGENGHWQPLDQYIIEHTTAKVTHSICTDCLNEEMQKIDRP